MSSCHNLKKLSINTKKRMSMKSLKKIGLLALTLAACATGAQAQDKIEANISADIVSQYIWRGQEPGQVSLQPTLGLGYKGLSLTAWGSVGLSKEDDPKEFDLTLAYQTGGFHIGVTDYYISADGARYFLYDAHKTAHTFEANVGYDFGPVALNWYTNFAGYDGLNKDGDRAYSSYVEATVPFRLAGLDWQGTLGAVPYATDFYADASGFAVTNVAVKATKDLKITDSFSVPVFAQVAANPSSQKAYFVVGFTLQP